MNTPLNKTARQSIAGARDIDPVESLELHPRITNRLHAAGIQRIEQLCRHGRNDLLKLPHLGARSLHDIEQALARANRSLRSENAS